MGIKKSDLLYKDEYSWTTYEDDDPKVTGNPDSTLLSRKEGYEVLYFINKYMKENKLSTVAEGQKVEKMIHKAPKDKRSHKHVSEWIVANWNK